MSQTAGTASVTLVTIIAPYEDADALGDDLRALGVTGYTTTRANGRGLHGPRNYGVLDAANTRLEVLVRPEVARKILEHVSTRHAGGAVLAFAVNVEAAPASRFA